MTEAAAGKQIRPKVRRKTATAPAAASTDKLEGNRDINEVEEVRQRMKTWMGLNHKTDDSRKTVGSMSSGKAPAQAPPSTSDQDTAEESSLERPKDSDDSKEKPAKSILRTPKYTRTALATGERQGEQVAQVLRDDGEASQQNPEEDTLEETKNSVICKDFVMERDPSKPMLSRKAKPRPPNSHASVEGYVPTAATSVPAKASSSAGNNKATGSISIVSDPDGSAVQKESSAASESQDPLILHSLEELFQAAGELPQQHDPRKITEATQLLEANIAFSVMSADQYNGKLSKIREQHEEERQAHLRIFTGTENIFGEDDSSGQGSSENESDDDEDDDLVDVLLGGNVDDEDVDDYYDDYHDEVEERQPRAFRLLWDTLTEWLTPAAVEYITHLKSVEDEASWKSPAMGRSDVEASRCAGLMAMVRLYLPKSLEELGLPTESRRKANTRLGELLRLFRYSLEAPKLPVKLWKSMTCILLEMVMVELHSAEPTSRPPSIEAIGMTLDEYRYLTRSVVKTFATPAC